MAAHLPGIHNVTAIATDPQRNLDFYTQILGLRLVKQTVNFDDPGTYHLYFGDETGRPGTILTFFPWPLARSGSRGTGQVTVTSFSVPEDSLGMWSDRLRRRGVIAEEAQQRFDEQVLTLLDPDGLKLELIGHKGAESLPFWAGGRLKPTMAVRGFHGVTLTLEGYEAMADLLTGVMGFHHTSAERNRFRFSVDSPGPGVLVDLLCSPDTARGQIAAGTVHHVAFRVGSNEEQLECRRILAERGMNVSPVLDRTYFRSIYFREPGGVLFEIATDSPGFTADEATEDLGSSLRLPEWLEPQRQPIEASLPELVLPE